MKKGFTLLELIVVIIIIGILATLGVTQYGKVIEKMRGAEAKTILGSIRSNAAAIYMQYNNDCTTCTAANLSVSTTPPDYPSACATTHYFSYAVTAAATGITTVATRCTGATGKPPGGPADNSITLLSNFSTGADTWTIAPAGAY